MGAISKNCDIRTSSARIIPRTKMNGTRQGLSLNLKFFFLTAFIIILLIAVTLWFSSRRATTLANDTIRADLKQTLSVFDTFQKDRYDKLKIATKIIAENSYIQAYIQEADRNSILDLAKQTEERIKS